MNLRYSLHQGALAALLALGGLTSCGPSYYLAVQPTQPDSEWPDGRPSMSTNFDKVEVQVGDVGNATHGASQPCCSRQR